MFFREKPEPLNIKYAPPPDGTYPSRLLVLQARFQYLSQSIWLNDGDSIVLEKSVVTFRRDGQNWKVIPLNTTKPIVRVNGQAVSGEQVLSDGDFIQWKKDSRAIFQADPVKDRRLLLQKPDYQLPNPVVSVSLLKQVVMNSDGLSFNGGKDFAQWGEILYLQVVNDPSTNLKVAIHRVRNGVGKELALKSVTKTELQQLVEWLYIAIPFDLSVYEFGIKGAVIRLLPDAYYAAAYEKILAPYQNGQRSLPANLNFIFGVKTRLQWWRDMLLLLGSVLAVFGSIFIVFQFILPVLVGENRTIIIFIAGISLFLGWVVIRRIRQWMASRNDDGLVNG